MNPILTEPGIKNFLRFSLKQNKKTEILNYNLYFNIIIATILILSILIFLFIKYKGKPSIEEMNEKNNKIKDYIYSKINKIQNNSFY
jgi:hypothetical protein